MKIGIISDTHGCARTWEKVYNRYFLGYDLIIHAGDILYHGPRNDIPEEYNPKQLAELLNDCPIPMIVASGNCDADVDGIVLTMPIQSPYAYLMVEGVPIVVNHGHTLTKQTMREMAEKFKAALFITGHTHVTLLEKHNGVMYLNPGSPAMSKNADKCGTIARLVDHTIEVLDVETGRILMSDAL
ncbi:MAG: phosphodiesterase, family [Firmicutes bacterium]|nr:phosphodiesterase, family [Bacillota bacterium]